MRFLLLFVGLLTASFLAAQVRVRSYYRADGTYVQSHHRSNPDGNPFNNWSYPGNYNPFTGEVATGNGSSYLNNYYNRPHSSGSVNLTTGGTENSLIFSGAVTGSLPPSSEVRAELSGFLTSFNSWLQQESPSSPLHVCYTSKSVSGHWMTVEASATAGLPNDLVAFWHDVLWNYLLLIDAAYELPRNGFADGMKAIDFVGFRIATPSAVVLVPLSNLTASDQGPTYPKGFSVLDHYFVPR